MPGRRITLGRIGEPALDEFRESSMDRLRVEVAPREINIPLERAAPRE
jgi:hypothetical protein